MVKMMMVMVMIYVKIAGVTSNFKIGIDFWFAFDLDEEVQDKAVNILKPKVTVD